MPGKLLPLFHYLYQLENLASLFRARLLWNRALALIISAMLKKFVLMLIVLFTLQMSWAVASAYCMHETDKTAQHFGHHPHQHDSGDANNTKAQDEQAEADKSSPQKAAAHPDCASCASSHLGGHSANFRANPNATNSFARNLSSLHIPLPFSSRPERPKWMALA